MPSRLLPLPGLLSEIFPNRIRGAAMAAGTFALWVACFVLTYSFPLLNAALGAAGSFLLYGVICLVGAGFIYARVPETKGITLEALEEQLSAAGATAIKEKEFT
ncbi:sugar transporter [Serratia liquefaciens FK01]|nr:sugar transporter [Serratia liquefaciens FK01]